MGEGEGTLALLSAVEKRRERKRKRGKGLDWSPGGGKDAVRAAERTLAAAGARSSSICGHFFLSRLKVSFGFYYHLLDSNPSFLSTFQMDLVACFVVDCREEPDFSRRFHAHRRG